MAENFHYTGNATLEALTHAVNYNRYLENILLNFIRPQSMALDFGAGIGTFAKRLKAHKITVDCVEPDLGQCHQLIENGFKASPFLQEHDHSQYDRIYTLNVLEHIEDDNAALAALYKALRPKGRLLIFVPAFSLLYTDFDAAVGHVRRYHKTQLRRRIEDSGFTCLTLRYVDSVGFFAWLVMKYLPKKSTGTISPTAIIAYDRLLFPISRLADLFLYPIVGKNLLLIAEKP